MRDGGLFCYLKVTKMVKTFVNSRNSYTFAIVKNNKIMKKRVFLSTIALCFTVLGMVAQRSYTFNAVALNVDGLPESILGVSVNDGAPGASGATLMGSAIAKQNWDIVGLSEDFNYHAELTAPLASYYHVATHGGTVSGLSNSTDGLGLLVGKKNNTGFANETSVEWNTYNGTLDNGNDGLIEKGFRYYAVTVASGVVVDVYVLHMDAGSSSGDITAREKQLTQLATYIKGTKNKRPIIIIGDTNCRYTREQLKTGFIDVINADSRFTIKDAWVEKVWKGAYPTYGGDAMMWYNAPYNNNTGEVVDKIFYINNTESSLTIEANSYLHNTSFGVSDHYPVIVNFTVTDPTAKALTVAEKEQANTLADVQAGSSVVKPTWLGEQVVSGNSYYVMNVGTGKYIKVGATWQTQATSGYAGTPLTATALGNGKYALETVGNSRGNKLTASDYPYMDGMDSENHAWVLTPVNASGSTCQYYIEGGNGVLTTTTEAGNILKTVAKNTADDNQRWVFLTADAIRREMAKASSDYPFNFTPLLPSADFDKMETDAGYASKWSGFSFGGVDNGGTASTYGWAAVANTTSAVTAKHALGTLPAGNYKVSFEGFYRSRYKPSGLFKKEQDETRNVVVSFGSTNIAVAQNTSTSIGTDMATVAAMFRDNDTYLASATASLSAATDVALTVSKPATSSSAKGAWICLDDFRLMFYGTGKAPTDPTVAYKQTVVTKVNETYAKVLLLNGAGQAAYDISTVMYRYNNGMVTTEADATALCAMVDEAYSNACAAHDEAEWSAAKVSELMVHFTFDGTMSAVGGCSGTLYNNAELATLGGMPVLSLGTNSGYFNMGTKVGEVIAALDNFTISTNVYIPTTTSLDGAGNFIYTFSNSADIAADANGCIFFRAGATDTRYAISTERWETEQGVYVSASPFADGNWHTITYRQANGNGEIFVDGKVVSSANISINPSALGVTEYNFLGRPCYVGDAYLKGAMYHDFRIYKGAVEDAALADLANNLGALNTALYKVQIAAVMAKTTLDATVLYEDVVLPVLEENGVTVTWSSSNNSVVSTTGKVTRPAAGKSDATVKLTATFAKGGMSEQKVFEVTVPAEVDNNLCVQTDLEAIVLKGRLDNLMSNLYLPTKGLQGSAIAWSSSAPKYLDANGELLQQAADEKYHVTLTATATKGSAKATRTFDVYLAKKQPLKYYLFAYFNGNAQSQEQICFALSEDGYNYTPLNEGNPIINSSDIANKKAVRDPHILRGEDGYFYMVVTDMRSDEGWSSNDGLVLLRSEDMVNWTHSAIDFPTAWPHRFDRNSLTQVWAPQTIYDPEEGKYMVYYAIGESGKNYITYYSYANDDFTELTEPQVLYNHGGENTIDADIVYYNGLYHMFFKTEGQGNGIQKATAKTLRGEWTPEYKYLQQTDVAVEGSGVFRLIDSDTWVLMYDCYTSGMYQYCTSTDLSNFTYKCNSANTSVFTPRHGTTVAITAEEACRLYQEWPTKGMFAIEGLESEEEESLPTGNTDDAPWSITAERIPAIADNASNWVVSGSWTTWTSTADGSGFSVPYVRIAKSGASSISKTLNYLPEGTYTLSASCMSYYYSSGFLGIGKGEKDVSGVTLFANSATTKINTKSGKAAKTLSVNVTLSGTNTLKFGINATSSNKATILAMDNVELVYQGSSAQYISGINKITDSYISAVASTNTSAVAAALANLRAARKAYVVHLAEGVATPADVTAWTEAIEALADAAGTSRSIADDEDGTADIEAEEVVSEPIVVAVYTLGGVRIESVQTGLNILLMSDGTTRKVFVK